MINVSLYCFLFSYLLALGSESLRVAKNHAVLVWVSSLSMFAGMVAHTIYLFNRHGETQLPPLLSSSHDWLLVLAWLVAGAGLVLTLSFRKLAFGLFSLPCTLLLVFASMYAGSSPTAKQVEETLRFWKILHTATLALGFAGVVIGLILSLMFLIQHRRLKQKKPVSRDLKLPNLESLAWYNRWAIIVSVPLLTLGMGTGVAMILYLKGEGTKFHFGDPVIIGYAITWLAMIFFFGWLLSRTRAHGKQVASLTLWACGFVVITVVGLQVLTGAGLVLDSWHG